MEKPCRKISFNFRMRFGLLIFFCALGFRAFAQQDKPLPPLQPGQVEGVVYDKDTKDRIARTNIINTTTGKSFYNNLKGEFRIDAHSGDRLVFLREEYLPDTIIVKENTGMAVYLAAGCHSAWGRSNHSAILFLHPLSGLAGAQVKNSKQGLWLQIAMIIF